MKKDIHPTYHPSITVTCSCGHTFAAGSTRDEITTELCSNCHPFYSGKQKIIDTAGRIEKFKQRMAQSGEIQKQKADIARKAKEAPVTPEAAAIDASAGEQPTAAAEPAAASPKKPAAKAAKAPAKPAKSSVAKAPAKKAATSAKSGSKASKKK